MSQNKIGIIGCGWLGLPLAKEFISNNYKVKGSTTTKEKLEILKTEGIEAYLIDPVSYTHLTLPTIYSV